MLKKLIARPVTFERFGDSCGTGSCQIRCADHQSICSMIGFKIMKQLYLSGQLGFVLFSMAVAALVAIFRAKSMNSKFLAENPDKQSFA